MEASVEGDEFEQSHSTLCTCVGPEIDDIMFAPALRDSIGD